MTAFKHYPKNEKDYHFKYKIVNRNQPILRVRPDTLRYIFTYSRAELQDSKSVHSIRKNCIL